MSYIDDIIESKRKELLDESILINEKDIYYNKEKFDSGEINLCFITGHSGSGKSTMGRNMQSKNIEHYELDDLQCIKDRFTMDNLKEYGDLIYSYFNGPGKRFYITYKELVNNNIPGSEYEDIMYKDFVHYAMTYAKTHKNIKFVLEGVWLFCNGEDGKPWFTPEEFKNYAFYIKGTSMIVSKYRGAKRDANDIKDNKVALRFIKNFFVKNWKWYIIDEKRINVFRKYFSSLTTKSISESVDKSVLDKNFKKKTGGNFKYIDIKTNKSLVKKYLSNDKYYNETYKECFDSIDGEIVIDLDNNILAGYVFVIDMFITPLFVYPKYRGYGLGDILTRDAVKKYKARRLWVFKDNEVAIKLYKKHGFKVFYEDDEPSILMATEEKYARDVIESLNESVTTNQVQLYFISTKENIKSLSPRIPDNFFTRKGYEDNKTPRVCFSTDIGKCLMGLSSRCAGQKYYVYQPVGEYEVITPTKKQVPDVEIIDEKWICEKVEIECIGEILCTGDKGEDGIPYTYGHKNEYKAELYEWNWKWLKKYNNNTSKYYSDKFSDVKSIVDSLPKNEMNYVCNGTFKNSPFVIYREVIVIDNLPVAFIDIYSFKNKSEGIIVLATRYGEKYRHKGYMSELLLRSIEWAKKDRNIKTLVYPVKSTNKTSIALAHKFGFSASEEDTNTSDRIELTLEV